MAIKRSKKLLLLAAVPLAMLAYYQAQQSGQTLQQLEAQGFRVDQRLQSDPPLVIDRRNRRMAAVYPGRHVEFGFDQVVSIEAETDIYEDSQQQRLLVIRLQQHPPVTLKAATSSDTQRWLQDLRAILGR